MPDQAVVPDQAVAPEQPVTGTGPDGQPAAAAAGADPALNDVTGGRPVLLGIDFGGTKMAVGVADADGRLLVRERVPTHAEQGAPQALDRALDLAASLVGKVGGVVTAAGIASPGVVRPDGIDLAPNVPGWDRLRLADAVRDRFGQPAVAVDNDLNAAALAELRVGALRDADPGLVVGLGTGVAAAVTVRGAVLAGHRGAAGEIGYAVAGAPWPGTMLELDFSGRALDRLAAELGLPDGAAGLAAAAEVAGPARDALTARVDELARHLVTCCLLLDPQRVVLVGGVAGSDLIRGLLVDRLGAVLPYRPEVVLSRFADDAALHGAVLLAAEAVPASR
ncbi:ROK family protein [Micromonospora cathayae]|uniref:ROK family protein n=1 Tax=Micromonospora cathayae TaxID=3028804 RepID=A0ABY7ZQW8_9ACTN|nr:ROK family protein [Micromonospora sp. HUAS 3]WDZ84612.1 ROK family protein [Micromonospora sp. HUAS 3]